MVSPSSSKKNLFSPGTAIWIPDKENCWLKAVVREVIPKGPYTFVLKCTVDDLKLAHAKEFSIECDDREELKVHQRNTTLNEDRLDDLTTLSYLTEPAVLSTIQTRYLENTIYTYSGLVLVSLNPYCDLSLYGESLIQAYSGKSRGELEPHIFAVAEDAFRSMQRDGRNQSIIISGESGAGKTISARWVMRYFAAVDSASTSESQLVEARVLASNPILEAFGNAKTTRNDNSSRFGKYVQIFFDGRNEITGAAIKTYLLEKTRVVTQADGERNYHIFYQLLRGASAELRKELLLEDVGEESFAYLKAGSIDGVDDAQEFKITQEALSTAGFTLEAQKAIFRSLAAILFLGNVRFTADDDGNAQLNSEDEDLKRTCQLLHASPQEMSKWLTKKLLATKVDAVEMKLNVWQAEAARDAVSKFLYERVFSFLVRQLNELLAPAPPDSTNKKTFIGVLDIYGFEKFDCNSFEQFCINYANEKLQHEFNLQVFKLEQELYEREAIEWSFINFADNQPCIDMIEARGGILDLLDEECRFPAGSDESFLAKLQEQIKDCDFFLQEKLQEPGTFTIRHFAYDVAYSAAGFLEKNRDVVPGELISLLSAASSSSTLPLTNPANTSKLSTGSGFRDSLRDLMRIIQSTQVHYIRCIKPNCTKEPLLFDPPFVLQQLRAGGIIETIKISAAGYPARWTFSEFTARYGLLARHPPAVKDEKEAAKALLQELTDLGTENFQLGCTKIFLRAGILAELEKKRSVRLREAATTIQSALRAIWIQSEIERKLSAIKTVQCSWRGYRAQKLHMQLRQEAAARLITNAALAWKAKNSAKAALKAAALIRSQLRAFYLRANWTRALKTTMAVRIQQAFRAHLLAHRKQADLKAARAIQAAWKRAIALAKLSHLRREAHSVAKLQQVSLGLEQKIVDLQKRIDALSGENEKLRSDLIKERESAAEMAGLQSQLNALRLSEEDQTARMKQLTAQLQEKDSQLQAAKAEISALQSQLQETKAQLTQLSAQESQQSAALSALQTAHDALKAELGALSATDTDALQATQAQLTQVLAEKSALESQFVRLERFVRQLLNKPSTTARAAMNSNTSLLNFVDAEVAAAEAKLVHLPATEKGNLEALLLTEEVERELLCLLQSALNFSDPFLPAKIIFSWLQLSLKFVHLHVFTEERVLGLLEAVREELSQSADDRKCAFWMANLCKLYGFVHFEISEKERKFKEREVSKHLANSTPVQSPSQVSQISVSELAPPTLLLLRAELLRLIDDIHAAWLRELCRFFGRASLAALLDHQSLSNYLVPVKKASERFFAAVLSSLVDGRAKDDSESELSVHDLLAALDDLFGALEAGLLPASIKQNLLQLMFEHMSVTCFNQFILRRGFICWKRAIQIQYNLSRFEEWYIKHSTDASKNPFNELLEAVKVVQLAKTRGIDAPTLQQCAPSLNSAQIRRLLTNYVPDEYEDGPVPSSLIRQLDESSSANGNAITLKTIEAERLTVQQELLEEIEPEKLGLSTEVPSTLWKIFLLNED